MRIQKRRRVEAKTDYRARLALLKSEKPRLVVRKSNRYITVQIIQSDIAQDKVVVGMNSKLLLTKGWPKDLAGSLKSLAAAYVTGFLVGKMATKAGIKAAILDIGLNRNISKSRLYAALKGAVDAGLSVPHSPEVLPEMESIKNEKTGKLVEKLAKDN